MEVIFFEPYLQEKIWGGNKLHSEFGLNIPSEHTGEAWMISAHPNGPSKVVYPEKYKEMTLGELYDKQPQLFGEEHPEPFPLLIKILDAQDDLSIQVHPDDFYAKEKEGPNELGKTECWYIISAEPGAKIIYGHHANSQEEFKEKIKDNDFNHLFREIEVQPGDFFDVPAGTIHAIGSGITILETQQSSDTTYRVYDYNRTDSSGNKRELHINQALDVSLIPHKDSPNNKHTSFQPDIIYPLMENDYFKVLKIDVANHVRGHFNDNYFLFTVVDGEGEMIINDSNYQLKKSDAFILLYGQYKIDFTGNMTMIASCPVL